MSFREQIDGFPVKQMFIVSLIRFLEPLAFTSLFPYLYFMIRDFEIADKEQDISKYSGYLASSFAFCQFLFCVRWGKLSNKIGRKPVLLTGLLGTSVSLVLFGFSRNYYWALIARSLAGCLNGNIAVLRTMVGEIATARKHQALAFSTIPLLFNFGSVIGPLIGGSRYFTRPKLDSPYNQNPENVVQPLFLDSFVDKHPYALSNIVVSCFLWFSFICGFLFLEETNEAVLNRRDYGLDIGDWILNKLGYSTKARPWHYTKDDEATPLLVDHVSTIDSSEIEQNQDQDQQQEALDESNFKSPIFTPQVVTVILSNCIISLHSIIYSEFTPVFLGSSYQNDNKFPFRIHGGLGLDPSFIGSLFSSTGIMGMLIILVIFPYIDRKLGTINGYRFSLLVFPLVYFFIPLSIFTVNNSNNPYSSHFPRWVTPILLYTLTSLKTLASATGLPQVMILNHRAAKKEHRAYVNSFTMSMLALARCTGPITFGYIMSFGNKLTIGWLGWWCLTILAMFGCLQSFLMKDYDD